MTLRPVADHAARLAAMRERHVALRMQMGWPESDARRQVTTLGMLRLGYHLTPEEHEAAWRIHEWILGERHCRGAMTVREVVRGARRRGLPRVAIAVALLWARGSRNKDCFWKPLPTPRRPCDLGFGLITEKEAALRRPARAARGLLRKGERVARP